MDLGNNGSQQKTQILAPGLSPQVTVNEIRCNRQKALSTSVYSPQMLSKAVKKLAEHGVAGRVELLERDIDADLALREADLVIMNWSLQFVRPICREQLLARIAESMRSGGALLLSEKILLMDSLLNRLYIEFYYDYKRQQGYTDTEIRNKREALENVLIPYRSEENRDLLKRYGFTTVDSFFRWFNFESLVAIRG